MAARKTRKVASKRATPRATPTPLPVVETVPELEQPPTPAPTVSTPLALPPGVDRVADLGTLYTLRQVAERLELSVKTVRRMVERGELIGAHLAPMPGGKGEQWLVPYSTVVQVENARRAAHRPDPTTAELEGLRTRVAELERALAVEQALSRERSQALEQLHLTWRLSLNAAPAPRRRWRRGSAPGPN